MPKSPSSKNTLFLKRFPLAVILLVLPLFLVCCPVFTKTIHAASVTLSWDANTESDLDGYKIYYSKASGRTSENYTTDKMVNVTDETKTSVTVTGLDLYTRYYFVATAYNRDGYESDYSNEVDTITSTSTTTITTSGGSGSGGGGCFIATAAYGSELSSEVLFLKEFRDDCLLKTSPGRAFVDFYYRISPPIANVISKHDFLRGCVRVTLTPIITTVKYPILVGFSLFGLILAVSYMRIKRTCRRNVIYYCKKSE